MKVKYRVALQSEKYTKTYDFTEEKTLRIGTQFGCQLLLPSNDDMKEFFFVLFARKNQVVIECSPNVCLNDGKKQMKSMLPADFTVIDDVTKLPLFTVTIELYFEKKTPDYVYAYEIPQGQWIRIGGMSSHAICIQDHLMGQDSVSLLRNDMSAMLRVDKAQYGIYVNGTPINDTCDLNDSAFFSINGYEFFYRSGYLYVDSHAHLRLPQDWKRIETINSNNHLEYPKFNRGPRFIEPLNEETIEILDPPPKREPQKSDLIMRIVPTLAMLVVTLLLRGVVGGGGLYVVISAVSMSIGMFTSIYSYFKNKKDIEEENATRSQQYESYIARKKEEIELARCVEREVLNRIYRAPEDNINAIWGFSAQLFDRSTNDSDFLQVYMGTGRQLAKRAVSFKKQETITPGDELMQLPEQLSNTYRYVENVPIVSDLAHANAVGIVGTHNRMESILRNMTFDLCTRHLSKDVQLFYMINAKMDTWLRWLPHVQNTDLGVRNIVCSDESRVALLEYLYSMLAERENTKCVIPHCVVFVQNDQQIKKHPLAKYLHHCASLGVTFVFMEVHREYLPDSCDEMIMLDTDTATGKLVRRSDAASEWNFVYSLIDETTAEQAALRLAPIYCEEISVEGALPGSYSFFDSFDVLSADELDIGGRWKNADVSKSLAAPIGVNARGEIVYLDIHEKAHGPHGLVAGTTGSGKSEFLQSYMASMSLCYSPYEVAFLIIDFKGGGMANQLEKLPHLVGTITNIDGREIARSLKSIKAELEKRQRLFDEAKINHIDKYIQLFKQGKTRVPLPHLIIVVDEFAELKAAQPEFMDELISAARIGRSLGIHLILATQKPAGQVNDQIWSNSRFRLCFKVQSGEDSNEMLRSPLASEIKEPGRGYLQVGNNEIFELFQSAYSGGSVRNETREVSDDFTLAEVSLWGERKVVYNTAWKKDTMADKEDKTTQLRAVVSAINEYCNQAGITPLPGICLPALPEKLPYQTGKRCTVQNGIIARIGRYDDPAHQSQGDVEVNLTTGNLMIIGSAQTGKTTALQTIIRSLTERYSSEEVNLYILDFASMILTNFETLAHVGGVAVSSEQEKVQNLFRMLLEEMAGRKKTLLSMGVSSYSSYLESNVKTKGKSMPQMILVIDNYTVFRELYETESEQLLKICREGLSAGISVIIANSHTAGLGYKYMANFSNRMAFYCHDGSEYSSLFDYCRMTTQNIPGRGLIKVNNQILEFQSYLGFAGLKEMEQTHAVKSYILKSNEMNLKKPAKKIPIVPELIVRNKLKQERPELFKVPYSIPIGMNYVSMEIQSLDLTKIGAFGICGREGMGKTNLLMNVLYTIQENIQIQLAEVYIVDSLQRRLQKATVLSCVQGYFTSAADGVTIIEQVYEELKRRKTAVQASGLAFHEVVGQFPMQLVILSGQDTMKAIAAKSAIQDKMMEIVKELYIYKACVIVTEIDNVSVSYSGPALLKYLKDEKKTLMFEDVARFKFYDTALKEERAFAKEIGPGDGYGYKNGKLFKLRTIYAQESMCE